MTGPLIRGGSAFVSDGVPAVEHEFAITLYDGHPAAHLHPDGGLFHLGPWIRPVPWTYPQTLEDRP